MQINRETCAAVLAPLYNLCADRLHQIVPRPFCWIDFDFSCNPRLAVPFNPPPIQPAAPFLFVWSPLVFCCRRAAEEEEECPTFKGGGIKLISCVPFWGHWSSSGTYPYLYYYLGHFGHSPPRHCPLFTCPKTVLFGYILQYFLIEKLSFKSWPFFIVSLRYLCRKQTFSKVFYWVSHFSISTKYSHVSQTVQFGCIYPQSPEHLWVIICASSGHQQPLVPSTRLWIPNF